MKNLLFIPYQDIYDFDNSGIMTREYAMLLLLLESGIENLYCIGKPRTLLDAKYFKKKNSFPENSYEYYLKNMIAESKQLRYLSIINSDVIIKKRAWWPKGYSNIIKKLDDEKIDFKNTLVYSNSPFSYNVIEYCQKKGATIIFDMMDNLCTHPSLNIKEQEIALKGYSVIAKIADFFSCNSLAIKDFCRSQFNIEPHLIKNGVFKPKSTDNLKLPQYAALLKEQKSFKRTVGYIGKLGLRVDENLVNELSLQCPDTLFVFIGPHLNGQRNNKLINLFKERENILYLGPISSVYIYSFLEKFDVLSIPHAVGERENGGDPLKLYQYLNTMKPIITTPILGVEEFENLIKISNNYMDWVNYLNEEEYKCYHYNTPEGIFWRERANNLVEFINR